MKWLRSLRRWMARRARLTCPRCNGLGQVRQAGYGDPLWVRCPTCDGTGLAP